jgi:hypothetical protein
MVRPKTPLAAKLMIVCISGGLFIWGCNRSANKALKVLGTISDEKGNSQLVLRYVNVDVPFNPDANAFDFYSLDWEIKEGANWTNKSSISRASFQKGCPRHRWVSKIQSFDHGNGRAILQVGEEKPPNAAGTVRVTYSWREWDVLNNKEVRTIRVCDDPFETLEDNKDSK